MRALHFTGNKNIVLEHAPDPKPRGNEVVVRIKASAICGTDRENFAGAGQKTIPGHENAGEVIAVDKPTWIRPGMRVAVNCHITCGTCEHCFRGDLYFCEELSVIGFERDGGFADYLKVPESCCMPLDDEISYIEGALLVDVLGTAYRAVKRAKLSPCSYAAVWGAGPIGLACMLLLKTFGVHVAVVDLSAYRNRLAHSLGADITVSPEEADVSGSLKEWTGGTGLEAAFECTGSEGASLSALENVTKRGTLVLVGVGRSLTINPWEDMIKRECTLTGSRSFQTEDFARISKLIARGLPIEKIITHRYGLEDAKEAFSVFASGRCGKVIFAGE